VVSQQWPATPISG